jgi:hypothetical protein
MSRRVYIKDAKFLPCSFALPYQRSSINIVPVVDLFARNQPNSDIYLPQAQNRLRDNLPASEEQSIV